MPLDVASEIQHQGVLLAGVFAQAAQIATTATGAINAISNAGDARGDAFEDIKSALVQQGVAPEVAEEIALKQSLPSAAVGGLAGYLGGKTGLESAVMAKDAARQGAGSIARQALKAGAQPAASEMLGELPEEVLPQVATNLMAMQHDGRSVAQDVGRTMAETMIGAGPGAVLAGGAGARNEYVAQRAAQMQLAPESAPAGQTPAAAPVLEQAATAPAAAPVPQKPQPHPTVQAADAVVRELALENGVPLETVLPPSAIDPVKEARAAELSMRAMDGEMAATEQAELAALQQEMAARLEMPQATGENEHGAETDQAQPTAAQGTEWQQAPQGAPVSAVDQSPQNASEIEANQHQAVEQSPAEEAPQFNRSAMKDIEANIRRGREALAHAITEKTSVHRAMFRNGLGWVDFVWGDEGRVKASGKTSGAMGLAHILEARQRKDGMSEPQVMRLLDGVVSAIAQGKEVRRYEFGNAEKLIVAHEGVEAILTRNKGSNAWVLSGWEMKTPSHAGRAGYVAPSATALQPTTAQLQGGEGDASIVPALNDDSQVRQRQDDVESRAGGKQEGGQEGVESAPRFNRSETTQQAYEQRIDALFAGAKPNRIGVRILDRSDVLGLLGHADKPVLIAESKVVQGQANHPRITAEVWKKIPQWLDAPAAVFESDTDGGLVFLAPETIYGSPVSLIVLPDKDGRNSLGVHLLLNAYDRSRSTPFGRWVRDGLLKYVDQKKFPALFESVAGRRLPGTALQNKPGTSRILTEKNLAGWRKENAPQFNRAEDADDDIRFQRAWHGTPHRGIEKTGFQLNKIGTGEGAQAYGWGMYFASQKEVAEEYRKKLSNGWMDGNGQSFNTDDVLPSVKNVLAAKGLNAAIKEAQLISMQGGPFAKRAKDSMEILQAAKAAGGLKKSKGQLYKVEVPEDSDLLDWDKPLHEQPQKVQEAIEQTVAELPVSLLARHANADSTLTGRGLMQGIRDAFAQDVLDNTQFWGSNEQKVSQYLNSLGIPGLRYLDGNSRTDGEGSHNYVIWDENLLTPEAAEITPMYSRSETTKAAYEQRIDELFAGEKPRSQGVRVLDRSDMLGLLGMGDGPVHVVESKVEQGRYNHGLTATDWKKVPEWLDNPAAVFDSDTQPGRLVFIAPELVRGSPVRMIIDPRPDGKGVNLLINAYDAERNPFARWINDGLLRYVDTKKTTPGAKSFQSRLTGLPDNRGRGNSADVLSRAGLQLPRKEMQNKPGMPKILTEKNLAGWRKDQSLLSNRSSDTAGATHDNRIIRDDSPDTQRAVGLLNRYFEGRGGDAHSFHGVRTEGIDSVVPLAQAFGAKVVGIQIREGLTARQLSVIERFNGARYQGYIYLNAATNRPHLAVLGHEMAHEMRAKRPDLYDRMVDAITPYIRHKEYGYWAFNDVVAKDVKDLDKKQEEFIGEVLSDGFMEPEFWRALGKKNKQLLVQVQNFLARMLQKIAATVGYTRKTEAYLTDYERVMQIAGEVMGEYGLDQGKFHRMAGIDLAPLRNNPIYSRSASTQQAYEQRIDELFAGEKAQAGTRVLDRSDLMGMLGYPDVPLILNEAHLRDGLTHHPEMTAAAWKKVPQWLDNPALAYGSLDPKHPNRVVVIAPEKLAGYPVVMAVEPNPQPTGGRSGPTGKEQLLVTVFAKTSGGIPVARAMQENKLLYVDKTKAPEIDGGGGGQFPTRAYQNQGRAKILTEKNLAGWRRENAPQFSRKEGQGKAGKDKTPPQQWTLATPGRL
ncbi:MAG: hypothetical protein Q4A11_06580, partial [Brachymonas sp.]|nr:hypothetical protein [Brachymonas sp.]